MISFFDLVHCWGVGVRFHDPCFTGGCFVLACLGFKALTLWGMWFLFWLRKVSFGNPKYVSYTLPETNIFAPENGWLEYYFPLGMAYFQVQNVSFSEGNHLFLWFLFYLGDLKRPPVEIKSFRGLKESYLATKSLLNLQLGSTSRGYQVVFYPKDFWTKMVWKHV